MALYPRVCGDGSYRDFTRPDSVGWEHSGGLVPTTWRDAQFPMELNFRIDEDELPDRLVLTLDSKEPATVGLPPPYSATVGLALYLTTALMDTPNLRLPLTSRPFHHPAIETRHTAHGVEVLAWEEIGTMKNGEYDQLEIWTMGPSGAFVRTMDPVTGDRVRIVDIDDDGTYETVVQSASTFAQLPMVDYWLGLLPYTEDILRWDGKRYSRAPAEVAQHYIRRTSQALAATDTTTYPPDFADAEFKRGLMRAIEDCYYWGATDLGHDLLRLYAGSLRDPHTRYRDALANGVEQVIAKWRTGSAWAGSAYGGQAVED
ncbi:MAG: hypothetical protein ABGY41_04590 [Candidatus Poribacteria bacterium]